ncbi:MAG: FAD-binding oxidoreductase [Phycisphaerae bacterium]|nr:FAD-binding oxidoreductase [Phycisphaerae bacterium]
MIDDHQIQSVAPAVVHRPDSIEAYVEAVRQCAHDGEKVVDYGRFHRGLGHAPPAGHVQVVCPAGPVEHHVADLSVTAAGGVSIGDLQMRLAENNQFLALDAEDEMTVAEVVAHDVSGPLRQSFGTCREQLLGLHLVDGRGESITVGGRTVKNVAGYDVSRLMVGNLNTLGLLASATLKTAVIPPQITRVEIRDLRPSLLDDMLPGLLLSDASPWYLQWSGSPATDQSAPPVLHLAYAGSPRGIDEHVRALESDLAAREARAPAVARHDGELTDDRVERRAGWRGLHEAAAWVRLVVPPAVTGRTLEQLWTMPTAPARVLGLPAHGVIEVGGDWDVETAREVDRAMGELVRPAAGMRIWLKRPQDTATIPPVDPVPVDWPVLARMKDALDPGQTLNPGRLF